VSVLPRAGLIASSVWFKKENLLGKLRSIFGEFRFEADVFGIFIILIRQNISYGVPRSVDMIRAFPIRGGAGGGVEIM
jgi:hypothetical protein